MGDARRFDLFGALCAEHLDRSMRIVDVAAGKGHLQANLWQRGFRRIESWDKRPKMAKHRPGYRYGYFDHATAPAYDAVVAMHPDEATDHAILYAAKRRVPAIVCPCCIKPHAATFWGRHSRAGWIDHLESLATAGGLHVRREKLRMRGCADVLVCTPREAIRRAME